VYARGIAHRPVFESRADMRYFLACLARAVRRGELEVHAYCILTTHFHLLVRSPAGRLSVGMDRFLNAFVRRYNRLRGRDGSLFSTRYFARPVDSLAYRHVLVRYIDRNCVEAGLASRPSDYPWCSAWHYVRKRRPPWLDTRWVDAVVAEARPGRTWDAYADVFAGAGGAEESALVERRARLGSGAEDPLDDLIAATPAGVQAWMRRKALLADGRALPLPCLLPTSISNLIRQARRDLPDWRWRTASGQSRDAWALAEAWLLRTLAATSQAEIGRRLGVHPSMAARRLRQASDLLLSDAEFATRLSSLAHAALRQAPRGAEKSQAEAASRSHLLAPPGTCREDEHPAGGQKV
jgi:hypothetical protein